MIRGVHTMFYTSDADATRAFLRDKLGLRFTDVGEGWLIFDLPESEMGCHPSSEMNGGAAGTHNISFYCDNVEKTAATLKARGVEFTSDIQDRGYGLVTEFRIPGGIDVQLYQPRYKTNFGRKAKPAVKSASRKKAKPAKRKVAAPRPKAKKRPARRKPAKRR